ncbi:hypothetical protein ACFQL1_06575 [Halomicroarcula sp. GCM10025709]|uniref:hypothetical protein n=1 Tax=Haloarcula TaxID=2237 RepID=UPI0024C38E19|nr:hypothetical protein [Halomicroarcula sp. YJ-61-S]
MGAESLEEKIRKGVNNPIEAVKYLTTPIIKGTTLTLSSSFPLGENFFKKDWDLLIILDTCRPDALRSVASEYSYLNEDEIGETISVGTSTLEWTAATFIERYKNEISDTALVSANGWPMRILDDGYRPEMRFRASSAPTNWGTVDNSSLGRHIPAWRYGEGRSGYSQQPQADAETVVDIVIDVGRRDEFDRVIAHIIEPHYPFSAAAAKRGAAELSQSEQYPWEYVRRTGDKHTVWNKYLTELRSGLDAVGRLLNNFEAERTLISADHGECFGEWGRWGHTSGSFNPYLRRVPITEVKASDKNTSEPEIGVENTEINLEENLRSLGYM